MTSTATSEIVTAWSALCVAMEAGVFMTAFEGVEVNKVALRRARSRNLFASFIEMESRSLWGSGYTVSMHDGDLESCVRMAVNATTNTVRVGRACAVFKNSTVKYNWLPFTLADLDTRDSNQVLDILAWIVVCTNGHENKAAMATLAHSCSGLHARVTHIVSQISEKKAPAATSVKRRWDAIAYDDDDDDDEDEEGHEVTSSATPKRVREDDDVPSVSHLHACNKLFAEEYKKYEALVMAAMDDMRAFEAEARRANKTVCWDEHLLDLNHLNCQEDFFTVAV